MYSGIKYQGRIFVTAIFCIIIALGMFALNYRYMLSGKAKSINKMLYDSHYELDSDTILAEKYCMLTINSCLGGFAEREGKVEGANGDTYYIALLDDNSVMAVKVNKAEDIDKLDTITSETYASKDFYSEHTLTIEGRVNELYDKDLTEFYDDALKQLGIKDAENNKVKIRYISIDATDNNRMLWFFFIVLFGGGVIVLFGDAIVTAISKAEKRRLAALEESSRKAAERSAAAAQHVNMNAVNASFDHSVKSDMLSVDSYLGEGTAMDKEAEKPVRFGDGERHERTKDGKISIAGTNLIK